MSTERVQMKMKLVQEQYDLKGFLSKGTAVLDALRAELRTDIPLDEIEIDRAEEMFKDLRACCRAIRALKENIARLEANLYG